jgi:superfamily II DNA helicase RecQ
VCRAAVEGRDLLLVMPTGSGKSLCYQLPALARGGTALVISPLISLMEDQVAKLAALGLRVARIHSGLDRAASRQACVDYLSGALQFLFIAPERLRVAGFPEMLAKGKLALIAIDEAHCISQWGHDFRPDYRMIGQHLPMLRVQGSGVRDQDCAPVLDPTDKSPSVGTPVHHPTDKSPSVGTPVLALTATATTAVQADIIAQLRLEQPKKFIHGFRRENLAVEVVEAPVPMRAGIVCRLLSDPARRPAIVYAQSRRMSEALAQELTLHVKAAAYHAGMDADKREAVQTAFQAGELEVVVATIAFGMGIDKANIRTVIHAGLAATLEGYYQEIGRAGRDGKMSRTILMHSYADRRTHEFLLGRDYPPSEDLAEVYRVLGEEPQPVEELRGKARLGEEAFDKALEKLHIHGGAKVDFAGNAARGGKDWKKTYGVQAAFRREQFEKVVRFTESNGCRMSALLAHFGDVEDAAKPCGHCDVCDPAGAVLRQFRHATARERHWVQEIVEALRGAAYKTPKGLRSELPWAEALDRDAFEDLIAAMVRAGVIEIEEAEFEKDGRVIPYRKIGLTEAGFRTRATTPLALLLSDGLVEEFAAPVGAQKRSKKALTHAERKPMPTARAERATATPIAERAKKEERGDAERVLSAAGASVATRLKAWRAAEAKRLGVAAFAVLNDRTLNAIAAARPRTPHELLGIAGMGPGKIGRFGEEILKICAAG